MDLDCEFLRRILTPLTRRSIFGMRRENSKKKDTEIKKNGTDDTE